MKPKHDKLIIATFAGLIIAAVAAFAITPANATGHSANQEVLIIDVQW